MNILFIFHSPFLPQNGGVERVSTILANEFRKKGHNVFFLTTRKPDNQSVQSYDCNQLFIDCNRKMEEAIQSYLQVLTAKKINIVINQEATPDSLVLLDKTPDTIKCISVYHLQPFYFLGKEREIKKASKPKSITHRIFKQISIACPILYRKLALRMECRKFNEMARVSDRIVLLSSKFIPRLINNCKGLPAYMIDSINNPNTFDNPKPHEFIKEKENLIIYVGRIEETPKNIRGFIRMWEIFSSCHSDWKAEIVGDGDSKADLEIYAKKRKLTNLSFKGKSDDVASYFKRASFVVLPSHHEGWGMVLTEGMAYGCIPVCFDSYEAAYDIISDGHDGIIARSFSAKDMADRIALIADNPSLMIDMSAKATEKVRRFNAEIIATNWEDLFKSL